MRNLLPWAKRGVDIKDEEGKRMKKLMKIRKLSGGSAK